MKKIIIGILLIFIICIAADAKTPQKGDYVRISTNTGPSSGYLYEGNITDIENGMVCLNCSATYATVSGHTAPIEIQHPFDVCISGNFELVWLRNEN